MMDGGVLDGMTGLIPLVITTGIVTKIVDKSFPSQDRGGRNGRMQGEQERYEPKRSNEMNYGYGSMKGMRRKGSSAGKSMRGKGFSAQMKKAAGGATNPSGLTSMMRKEGRGVMKSVAYQGHKLGSGSMGSLPGVGKVTPGKISDIGIGGNKMYDVAKHSMKARTLGKL